MTAYKEYPRVRDIFGSMVFNHRVMKEKLNPENYNHLIAAIEGRQKLDAGVADVVALAMKEWAISKAQRTGHIGSTCKRS